MKFIELFQDLELKTLSPSASQAPFLFVAPAQFVQLVEGPCIR